MQFLVSAIAVALVGLTIAVKTVGTDVWLVDLVTFFWPFVALFAVFPVLVSLFVPGWSVKLVSVLGMASVLYPLLWLPPAPDPGAGHRLRLLTANLFIENPDPTQFIALIARTQPDVVVTQETRRYVRKAIRESGLLPFESSGSLSETDDKVVFSRYPIRSQRVLDDPPVDTRRPRYPLRLVIDTPSGPVVLYAVHPDTPRSEPQWARRNLYLERVAQHVRQEAPDSHVIVAGDWNTPAYSAAFTQFFRSTGLRFARPGWYLPATRFTLRLKPFAYVGSTIDHVAVSPDLHVSDWQRERDFGSNHLPVIVDINLPQTAAVAGN